jgi:hypothetical protein
MSGSRDVSTPVWLMGLEFDLSSKDRPCESPAGIARRAVDAERKIIRCTRNRFADVHYRTGSGLEKLSELLRPDDGVG